MKAIKIIDMIAQTLIIISAVVIYLLNGFSFTEPDFLFVQLILGTWQMASCFLSLIFGAISVKAKLFHFATSVIYLLSRLPTSFGTNQFITLI
jgi:hypothetical protein